MSNPTRNDAYRSAEVDRRANGERSAASRTSAMLQESPNPEMFSTTPTRNRLSGRSLAANKKLLGYGGAGIVVIVVVVVLAMVLGGGGQQSSPSSATESPSASAAAVADLDPAKEVPGTMIPYRPELPDGMRTPSQTIQSMARNFYSLRSTAGVMPYFAPGSTFTEEFVANNIKNVQVGTKLTGLYLFPADADKLKNKKPLGTDPQVWLATAMFTLPDGKVYVESLLFMTVKVGQDYKIQEFGTFT